MSAGDDRSRTPAGRQWDRSPPQVFERRVRSDSDGLLRAAIEMGQHLGSPGVARQVLGYGRQIGRAVGLAQCEHRLIDDPLIGAVTDAPVDRPADPRLFADFGDTRRLHVDGPEARLEDGAPHRFVREQAISRHEAPGGGARGKGMGVVERSVGIEPNPIGDHQCPDEEAGVEPTGDAHDHDVIEGDLRRACVRVARPATAGPIPITPARTVHPPAEPAWENTGSSAVRLRPPARTTPLSSVRMGASTATRLVGARGVTPPSCRVTR